MFVLYTVYREAVRLRDAAARGKPDEGNGLIDTRGQRVEVLAGMRILTSVQGENWYNQARMRDLKTLREGWDEVARQERRSAEHLTIEQSVSIYLALCRDMAPQIRETEEIFRRDREAYLAELQSRLRRLNDLRRQQHGNLSEPG